MDERKSQQIEAIYRAARERKSDERRSYLAEACKDDDELRRVVEIRLLENDSAADPPKEIAEAGAAGDPENDRTLLYPGAAVGPFTTVAFLGRGGTGEVYRAFDPRLNRHVALKVLSEKSLAAGYQDRFIREARATASLNHPHIAHIYEIGEADGTCYIAMEYIHGTTLRQRMQAADCTLAELLEYLRQTADAVGNAHSHGVVHCDLKPDNIMVTRDGVVKVLDFGLAKLVRGYRDNADGGHEGPAASTLTLLPDTNANVVAGTIGYMSPEQAEGRTGIDQRSDIFSFGCMLFEAATGKLPFASSSVARTFHNLLYEAVPRITSLSPSAPPALQPIVDRCLAREPSQRYPAMEEVSRDVADLLRRAHPALLGRRMPDVSGAVTPAVRRPRVSRAISNWAAITVLFAAAALALGYWRWALPGSVPSVAVIPIANAANAPRTEYLSDGISENLIHALAQLPDLKVIARTSSFRFRGERVDLLQAARRLGVHMLVTVRAVTAPGGLHIAAELVDGKDGRQLWANQYDSTTAELPGVESVLAREIAERIRSGLTRSEIEKLGATPKVKPEAYELLLRGRYHMRLHTPADSARAASYYEQSLGVDPGFAAAHAELAHVYRLFAGSGILKPDITIAKAEAEVRRALAADPNLPEAHATLGDIRKDRWDWAGAETEYRRAIELSPNLAVAHRGLAIYLSVAGRFDEAISEVEKARQLDPLSVPTGVDAGAVYYNARRYGPALEVLKRTLELDPAAAAAWTWIAIINGAQGRFAQATQAYEKAMSLGDDTTATRCYYAYSLARSGRRQQAVRTVEELLRSKEFVSRAALAVAYLGLEQREKALQEIEAAYAAREPLAQYLRVESHFDALSSEPRFQQVCSKIGLPR